MNEMETGLLGAKVPTRERDPFKYIAARLDEIERRILTVEALIPNDLRASDEAVAWAVDQMNAIVDTRPKDGDAKQTPLASGDGA